MVLKDLATALKGIDALVLAVRHEQYLNLDPDEVVCTAGKPIAVIDCFGILDDNTITRYLELGCEVKGLGRGHIRRLKEEIGKRHRKSIRPNIRRDRASRLSGAAFPSLAP